MKDPRLVVVDAEPEAWVVTATETFDAIVLDLGAPVDHQTGKAYTHYVLRRVADRLAPGGTVAIPAASAFETPTAHASIARTVKSAGLRATALHLPLSTLGEWTVLIASREASPNFDHLQTGLSHLLTPGAVRAALIETTDRRTTITAPSTLHQMHAVESFVAEQGFDPSPP